MDSVISTTTRSAFSTFVDYTDEGSSVSLAQRIRFSTDHEPPRKHEDSPLLDLSVEDARLDAAGPFDLHEQPIVASRRKSVWERDVG